jgi:O-antigen ligase
MMHELESQSISPLTDEPRASFVLLSFLIVFCATVFFLNDADWRFSTYDDYALAADEAESLVADGNRWRQLSYLTLGAIGILLCIVPGRQRVNLFSLPFALLGMYVLVCIASFVWTDAAWLTAKRLAIGIFGLMAIVGAAKHLSTRDVIDTALGIGTILLATSVYAEVSLGTFRPLASEYRFAGIVHPNTQGSACGLMAIAAFFGMKESQRGKLVYFGLLVLAGGFLMLTKSRTSVAGCMCGVSAAWYLFASRNKQAIVGLGFPAAICGGLAALLMFGIELSSSADTAARFGRGADAELATLNGRVPLWSSLFEEIADRPLLGYGYQGFWTPDRIYEVSLEQEWTVPTAHSTFLDVVLSTGLLGGTFFALGVLVAFRRTIKRCLETAAPTDCFVFAAIVYAFIGAIFESSFSQPNGFEPFITGVALLHVISRPTPGKSPRAACCMYTNPFPHELRRQTPWHHKPEQLSCPPARSTQV